MGFPKWMMARVAPAEQKQVEVKIVAEPVVAAPSTSPDTLDAPACPCCKAKAVAGNDEPKKKQAKAKQASGKSRKAK